MVAFSVSFENDYLHVLKMLRMAGIPLRAADRGKNDPLVVMGGAALFLNPEPLAPFADLIAVGEGEALVPRLLEALVGAATRARASTALTAKDGFYVPSRYEVALQRGRHGRRATTAPARVIRQRGWPGKMPLPQSVILTPNTEMSMKFMVEISRGCPCMCRFCWAGYNYLPVRGFSRAGDRRPRARGATARRTRSASSRPRCATTRRSTGIVDDLAGLGFEVSVASLRLDDLTPEFVFKLADTGVQGLTLAPECGSDRMRQDPEQAVHERRDPGQGPLDLRERHPEPEALLHGRAALGEARGRGGDRRPDRAIRERMLDVGRKRGRIGRIHPSVNPFVPKPGTPYQWLPMEDPKETDRKLQFLRKAFGRMPNVDAICKSARTGVSQSILALADRRVADALEFAAVNDVDLKRGMKAVGLDPAFYLFRGRGREEVLPWDIVDNGVSQDVLPARARQEPQGEPLAALSGDPGLHPLRRLRRDAEPVVPAAREMEGARDLAPVPEGHEPRMKGGGAMSWPTLVVSFATLLSAACATSTGAVRPVGLDQETELSPGQSVQSGPLRVTFARVENDSRCPADVVCVWEGDALVKLEVSQQAEDPVARELHTSGSAGARTVTYGGFQIELVRLSPATHSQQPIPAKDYRLVLKITQTS